MTGVYFLAILALGRAPFWSLKLLEGAMETEEDVPRHGYVLSSEGGMITNWWVEGKDILFPYQEMLIDGVMKGVMKYRGGMFFCLPNYGAVNKAFHLPQHGTLRTLRGVHQQDLQRGSQKVTFDTTLLAVSGQRCLVEVSAHSTPSKEGSRRLSYKLQVAMPRARRNTDPISLSPGIHPYFATPEGTAQVRVGMVTYPVTALLTEPMLIPFAGDRVTITIPGVGVIDFHVNSMMRSRTAHLVLWRDSYEYLCVEPIYDLPEWYGTASSYLLREQGFFSAEMELIVR